MAHGILPRYRGCQRGRVFMNFSTDAALLDLTRASLAHAAATASRSASRRAPAPRASTRRRRPRSTCGSRARAATRAHVGVHDAARRAERPHLLGDARELRAAVGLHAARARRARRGLRRALGLVRRQLDGRRRHALRGQGVARPDAVRRLPRRGRRGRGVRRRRRRRRRPQRGQRVARARPRARPRRHYTQAELYHLFDPSNARLPYVFDDFEWAHCADAWAGDPATPTTARPSPPRRRPRSRAPRRCSSVSRARRPLRAVSRFRPKNATTSALSTESSSRHSRATPRSKGPRCGGASAGEGANEAFYVRSCVLALDPRSAG